MKSDTETGSSSRLERIVLVNDSRVKRRDARFERRVSIEPADLRENLRLELNYEARLAGLLISLGHQVRVFDSYEDDLCTQIKDPHRAAEKLAEIIDEFNASFVLLDLDYFKDHGFGYRMLEWLSSNRDDLKNSPGLRFFIGSRYFGSDPLTSREALIVKFDFIRGFIDRFSMSSRQIAEQFFGATLRFGEGL